MNENATKFEDLPPDIIRAIIMECEGVTVFRMNKFIHSLVDEVYWKHFASVLSNKEYPPKHYSQDPRFSNITSWRTYAKDLKEYYKNPGTATKKRLMVISD